MTTKTAKFLETLPILDHSIKCNSIIIIPSGKIHDSGYETMVYVVTDNETKTQYKTNGSSDVLALNETSGWRIECLPQYHAVSLWRRKPVEFIPWYSSSDVRECI